MQNRTEIHLLIDNWENGSIKGLNAIHLFPSAHLVLQIILQTVHDWPTPIGHVNTVIMLSRIPLWIHFLRKCSIVVKLHELQLAIRIKKSKPQYYKLDSYDAESSFYQDFIAFILSGILHILIFPYSDFKLCDWMCVVYVRLVIFSLMLTFCGGLSPHISHDCLRHVKHLLWCLLWIEVTWIDDS